ncbi:MAG TPA: hypothetical protein VGQ88_01270 [Burkholderiales bacterium]|nr:hypothetical protein [Burkholderiales bacterium]
MEKGLRKTRARLTLPLFCLFLFATDFACSQTFKGILTPQTAEPPMPIVVELEDTGGRLSGTVSIASSFARQGRIIAGEIAGYKCTIDSDIGGGVILRLAGTCTPAVFVGRYVMRFPDARPRQGSFRLFKTKDASKAPSKITKQPKTGAQTADETQPKRLGGRRGLSGLSTTECLKLNTACLGACPRGEYNAEFLCTNSCKRKLAACKAGGKNSAKNAPVEPDKTDAR